MTRKKSKKKCQEIIFRKEEIESNNREKCNGN